VTPAAECAAGTTSLAGHLAARPFALALSSGFFGFYAHAGVILALEEAGLVPARLSGSSAGALVAGVWAAGVPARAMADELLALERGHFWDPAPGFGLLRGHLFRRRVEELVSSAQFASCRVPLAMSAFDIAARRTVVLDSGDLASAVCASCAFPGLLHPVRRDGRLLYDGGIADRPGLAGLAGQPAGEPTLHHHLASRSPWRRPGSPSLAIPVRADTISLRIAGLPRVHPFRLAAGRAALHAAHRAMRRALSAPVARIIDV
jgi:NTE family protein